MSELSNASYVNIMVESLKKKQGLVNTLYEKTVSQSECIKGKEYDDIDWAQFEIYMNEKDSAIADALMEKAPRLKTIYNKENGRNIAMFHLENGTCQFRTLLDVDESFDF